MADGSVWRPDDTRHRHQTADSLDLPRALKGKSLKNGHRGLFWRCCEQEAPMAIKRLATVSLATVALTGILGNGCAPSSSQDTAPGAGESTANKPLTATAVPISGSGAVLPDFTALVDRFGKAVVNIEVVGQPQTRMEQVRLPKEDPFFEVFRRTEIPVTLPAPQAPGPQQLDAAHLRNV